MRNERGVIYLETLIGFMPTFLLFLGTLHVADASVANLVVSHAASAAARAAVVVLPDDGLYYEDKENDELHTFTGFRRTDIERAADTILAGNGRIDSSGANVALNQESYKPQSLGGSASERELITARVSAPYRCIISLFCPGGLDMQAESQLVYQGASYVYEASIGAAAASIEGRTGGAFDGPPPSTTPDGNPRPDEPAAGPPPGAPQENTATLPPDQEGQEPPSVPPSEQENDAPPPQGQGPGTQPPGGQNPPGAPPATSNGDSRTPPPTGNGDSRTPPPNSNGDSRTPPPNNNGDSRTPPPNGSGDSRTPPPADTGNAANSGNGRDPNGSDGRNPSGSENIATGQGQPPATPVNNGTSPNGSNGRNPNNSGQNPSTQPSGSSNRNPSNAENVATGPSQSTPSNSSGQTPSASDGFAASPTQPSGTPSNSGRTPSTEDRRTANNDGRTPSNDGRTPTNDGRNPSAADGRNPANDGLTANNDGRTANNDGRNPSAADGRNPANDGRAANNDSRNPSAADGRNPANGGRTANNDGRSPTGADGRNATNDGRNPTGDGRNAANDGRSANGDGRTANNDGRSANGDGRNGNDQRNPVMRAIDAVWSALTGGRKDGDGQRDQGRDQGSGDGRRDDGSNRDVSRDGSRTPSRDTGDHARQASSEPNRDDLSSGLPRDLRDVPIVRDPSLTGSTVRVHYTHDAQGRITSVEMRVGPDAEARHIADHAETARTMQRYQGLSGRARILAGRIKAWFTGHPNARPGSAAWEARREIDKLKAIVDARTRALDGADLTPDERATLERERESYEEQLAYYESIVDDLTDEPGRGYVAAEQSFNGRRAAANSLRDSLARLPNGPTPGNTNPQHVPPGFHLSQQRAAGATLARNAGTGNPRRFDQRASDKFVRVVERRLPPEKRWPNWSQNVWESYWKAAYPEAVVPNAPRKYGNSRKLREALQRLIQEELDADDEAPNGRYEHPDNMEANHNIPAGVAEKHPLTQEAERREEWNIDNVNNGSMLPVDGADEALTDKFLKHRVGDKRNHNPYDKQVKAVLDRLQDKLLKECGAQCNGDIKKLPPGVLEKALTELEDDLIKEVEQPPHGDITHIEDLDLSHLPR